MKSPAYGFAIDDDEDETLSDVAKPYDQISPRQPLEDVNGIKSGMTQQNPDNMQDLVKQAISSRNQGGQTQESPAPQMSPLAMPEPSGPPKEEPADESGYEAALLASREKGLMDRRDGGAFYQNLAQALSHATRGVNTPASLDPLFANMQKQRESENKLQRKDIETRQKVMQAIEARKREDAKDLRKENLSLDKEKRHEEAVSKHIAEKYAVKGKQDLKKEQEKETKEIRKIDLDTAHEMQTFKGNKQLQQASLDIYSANKALGIAASKPLDNLTSRDLHLIAADTAKLASGGIARQAEIEAMLPDNYKSVYNKYIEFVKANPQPAKQAAYVKDNIQNLRHMVSAAQHSIDDYRYETLEAKKPYLPPDAVERYEKRYPGIREVKISREAEERAKENQAASVHGNSPADPSMNKYEGMIKNSSPQYSMGQVFKSKGKRYKIINDQGDVEEIR